MVANTYMENLIAKYYKNFNIRKDIHLCDKKISLFAEYKGIGARTFITQKDVIDKYEFNEYCIVNVYNNVVMKDVVEYTEYLKLLINELVRPHSEHKSSTITGVIVCNTSTNRIIENYIEKFKFNKSYKLYFHGWSEIRLLLVDLSKNLVVSNKLGNSVKKVYIPTSL